MKVSAKFFGICGLSAVSIYLGVFLVLAAIEPNYSHITHFPSELGGIHASNPGVMNAMFHFVGVLVWVFALGLHRELPPGRTSFWGPLMLAILGGSMFAAGFFQCDTRCLPTTFESQMHGVVGLPGLLASPLAPLFVYFRLKNPEGEGDSVWPRFYQKISLFSFALQVFSILMLLPFMEGDAAGVAIRLLLVVQLLWPSVMAFGLVFGRMGR
ncbi:DUF998 domain-containing protein [Kordiimonas lacus]|uniref:DUF998 domain-containing protein n=1 Tax=Kordiimonas lacus TaxID=637679 RepID=A0A1G7F5K3_9PROT|nr:DUF998 domain-containing protein [Kordiimonas lacus]SDE71171.1 Protein of unknown function [Kordiimonas lacus]